MEGNDPRAPEGDSYRDSRSDSLRHSNAPSEQGVVRKPEGEIGSEASRRPRHPQFHTFDSLIDPREIAGTNIKVKSPSSNRILSAEEYINHPMRPKCIRERQELIRRNTSQKYAEQMKAEAEAAQEERRNRWYRRLFRPCFKD